MELGMIGLGRMGANMTERLIHGGHRVVVHDIDSAAVRRTAELGAVAAASIDSLTRERQPPRIVWLMVPAGNIVEQTLKALMPFLVTRDIVIDGGNSNYKDSMRRAAFCAEKGIDFVDSGTSADSGWAHVGPPGAGHFVKMIHNGIEYGLMQAYAEGFALMKKKSEFRLDIHQIAEVWRHGSVVRSWLLDLTAEALGEDVALDNIQPEVADSGEGRWTVSEAL